MYHNIYNILLWLPQSINVYIDYILIKHLLFSSVTKTVNATKYDTVF